MQRFQVRLDGKTPLLINRMDEAQLLALHTKEKQKFTAPKVPREAAALKLYVTHDTQQPYIPLEMLMACLIGAGMFMKLDGKRQMSTAKSTLLPGFISLEDQYMVLLNPETKTSAAWEVDMRQGRNPNGGEAVCIIRPRFDRWQLHFSMLIDVQQIDAGRIRELVDIAGSRLGLGDFRPQRKGVFGQFTVGCWAAESTASAAE